MGLTVRQTICNECPFRRESMPGWLGSNTPEDFASLAINSDTSLACHTMVDQSLPRPKWEKAEAKAPRCRGALTMMRNECKMSYNRELVDLTKTVPTNRVDVFSHRLEFIKHHNGAKVKSWELK